MPRAETHSVTSHAYDSRFLELFGVTGEFHANVGAHSTPRNGALHARTGRQSGHAGYAACRLRSGLGSCRGTAVVDCITRDWLTSHYSPDDARWMFTRMPTPRPRFDDSISIQVGVLSLPVVALTETFNRHGAAVQRLFIIQSNRVRDFGSAS